MEGDSGAPPTAGTPGHQARTLAEKLGRLFQVMSPKGKPYSYQQVADAINARSSETGVSLSHATIWQLRTGKSTDPRLSHLQALADFFGVPLGYFTDDEVAARVDSDLDLVAALRDAGVRQVALRASGLSANTLQALTTMIEAARNLEGVQDSDPAPDPKDRSDAADEDTP